MFTIAVENFEGYEGYAVPTNEVDISHWLVDRVLGKANGKFRHEQCTDNTDGVFNSVAPPKVGIVIIDNMIPQMKDEHERLRRCDTCRTPSS